MRNGDSKKDAFSGKVNFYESNFGEKLGKRWGFNGGMQMIKL